MNLVDLLVVAIVAISALLGLSRGLVRELLGLGSWAAAAYAAWRIGPSIMPMTEQAIGNPDLADPAAYAITFVALLIILSLLANLVGRLVQLSALGGLDRTLGLVFGIGRGLLVLIAAYIPLALMLPPEKWPPVALQARSIPWIYAGAVWAADKLPQQYRPRVAPPPDGKPTIAADLLHATPEGRALGPAPTHTN
jgi:membrane protein required for colicin V production